MNLSKHIFLFSDSRLNKYILACNKDPARTVLLYKYNIQLSQSLYPLMSVLEISLRNAVDRELTIFFNDDQWLITKRNEFSNHPALLYKDFAGNVSPDHFFINKLNRAERKLRLNKVQVTHAKLVAELTFGFWVKFFDSNAIKLLKGSPLNAFKNRPSLKLVLIHSHLNKILSLRNRISHNEPICFNKAGELCKVTIQNYESNLIKTLEWIDADLLQWSREINSFEPVFKQIQRL